MQHSQHEYSVSHHYDLRHLFLSVDLQFFLLSTNFCFLVAKPQVITIRLLSFIPPMYIPTRWPQYMNIIQHVYCSSSRDNAVYRVKYNP